ncbi:MAG TPA: hypothetical protein PK453_06055 [Leptospiraceae bacterium]|nr:hypothetical protein [Leptospiraceae bacterium]
MIIANPVYDSAFKYLMEDPQIAKGIIGRIIGREILEIDFKPQEYATITSSRELTFLRMDFHAIILTEENKKQKVLIELQKSKQSMNLSRFREYLGEQYAKADSIRTVKDKKGNEAEEAEFYPIIIIYLLGYIENAGLPRVVCLKNQYYDVIRNQEIVGAKSEFLERLTHESYMLQLAADEVRGSTPLERLLTLFSRTDFHTKMVDYPDADEQPEDIKTDNLVQNSVKRLSRAVLDDAVKKQLKFEEEMEKQVQDIFNTLEERNKEIEERNKEIEESKKELKEKEQAIEKNKLVILNLANMLKKAGLSQEEIQKQTGLLL